VQRSWGKDQQGNVIWSNDFKSQALTLEPIGFKSIQDPGNKPKKSFCIGSLAKTSPGTPSWLKDANPKVPDYIKSQVYPEGRDYFGDDTYGGWVYGYPLSPKMIYRWTTGIFSGGIPYRYRWQDRFLKIWTPTTLTTATIPAGTQKGLEFSNSETVSVKVFWDYDISYNFKTLALTMGASSSKSDEKTYTQKDSWKVNFSAPDKTKTVKIYPIYLARYFFVEKYFKIDTSRQINSVYWEVLANETNFKIPIGFAVSVE